MSNEQPQFFRKPQKAHKHRPRLFSENIRAAKQTLGLALDPPMLKNLGILSRDF